jgi:hypothetical protein
MQLYMNNDLSDTFFSLLILKPPTKVELDNRTSEMNMLEAEIVIN